MPPAVATNPHQFGGKTSVYEFLSAMTLVKRSVHFIYFKQVCCHVQDAVTKFSKNLNFTEGFKTVHFKAHARCLSPCPQLVGGCVQGCQ